MLRPALLKTLETHFGVQTLTRTQKLLISALHSHADIIVRDMTGSGKTLGLVAAALSKSHPPGKYTNTLFLLPTRELALMVSHWAKILDPTRQIACLVHGEATQAPPGKIVFGTARKVMEMIEAKELDVSRLQTLIIDEVDRAEPAVSRYAPISKRLVKQIHPTWTRKLVDMLVNDRKRSTLSNLKRVTIDEPIDTAKIKRLQIVAASATVNHPVRQMLKKSGWMHEPVFIDVNGTQYPDIKHLAYYFDSQTGKMIPLATNDPELALESSDFPPAVADDDPRVIQGLIRLLDESQAPFAFLFANSSISTTKLVDYLNDNGVPATRLLEQLITNPPFANIQKTRLIVATEYEARGLDLKECKLVFILGLPASASSYLHMAGRTGRFGTQGTVISVLGGKRYMPRLAQTLQKIELKLD